MHRHRQGAQEIVGKRRVCEFEVSLVVELEQSRRERVVVLQVDVVDLWFIGCVAALFTDVHLL